MKSKQIVYYFLLLLFACFHVNSFAQGKVKQIEVSDQQTSIQMVAPNEYLLEIAGPNNYYYKYMVPHTKNISLSNVNSDGKLFSDGSYRLQITPILTLTDRERKELNDLRSAGDEDAIATYRLEHDLPTEVEIINISFGIREGNFVQSSQKEYEQLNMPTSASLWQQDHPILYADLKPVNMFAFDAVGPNLEMDNTPFSEDAQVFATDVIVQGSLCVGLDCTTGEAFGFDTERFKENNLRIHFDDTSASASFPANDWRKRNFY